MKTPVPRLMEDPAVPESLREDLARLKLARRPFARDAGMARLRAAIRVAEQEQTAPWFFWRPGFAGRMLALGVRGWLFLGASAVALAGVGAVVARDDGARSQTATAPVAVQKTRGATPIRRVAAPVVASSPEVLMVAAPVAAQVAAQVVAPARSAAPRVSALPLENAPVQAVDPAASDERFRKEIAQLAGARGLLERDPATALVLFESGGKEFHDGLFVQEWQAMSVLALARLGRHEEAVRRGAAFLQRFPAGPLGDRVRAAIAPSP